jgi:hypothetical protein
MRLASPIVTGLAASFLVFSAYALLTDPSRLLATAQRFEVTAAIYGLWAAAGWTVAAVVQRRGGSVFRAALTLLVLVATTWFIYLRPGVQQAGAMFPPLSGAWPWWVLGAVAEFAWNRWYRSGPRQPVADGEVTSSKAASVAGLAACLLFVAPAVLLPVAANWNVSGWMDSHSYDVFAHNIATGKVLSGNSAYMPVYQYGMAAVYYVFGHFFFAQQLVNAALAFAAVLFLCLAAWNIFRRRLAVALIALWVAFTTPMFVATYYTQIESWYIPIICCCLFCWSCYWRSPSTLHIVLVALAAAVGINTRNQGAFFFLLVCAAPLFAGGLPRATKVRHTVLAIGILIFSLVPWTVRNKVVEGRLSPSASRNAYYVAVLNDPRIGFYGLRYWEGWDTIVAEYERQYPSPGARERAMMLAALRTPFEHGDWFRSAMMWRTLAFYGLTPPGVFAGPGPVATNWATDWRSYVFWRMTALVFVALSILGLVTRPGRTTLFLAAAILANVAVSALAGGGEERVSYPVLPIHMLLALCAVFAPVTPTAGWRLPTLTGRRVRVVGMVAFALGLLVLCRVFIGRSNLYAPQIERAVLIDNTVQIDPTLPSLDEVPTGADDLPAQWQGKTVRLRFFATNYMMPPKFAGRVGWMPDFTTDPARETYYYGYQRVTGPNGPQPFRVVGVSLFGAEVSEPLREGDEVEAEGLVNSVLKTPVATYWIQVTRARKLPTPSSEAPAFF